ncbi:Uncharacterized protein FWK35_00000559 [Aphis craccivora]|uniref:Uncharacterized protein n=1 Tax=Aphis craccivora TaxID=307492 RepID=A0A6G0ZP69_APHCR|nr:Uncharacterized protein FWK35_00000559 [Aphis craccivora]
MICVFIVFIFVSVTTFWSSKRASIFKLSPVSDIVNIVGIWGVSKIKNFQLFSKKSRKTKKNNDGKTGIFTQNQFTTKSIFYMVVIQKLIIVNS